MPLYEYHCESNGRLVEVQHKMDERLMTWGELCERAGISAGPTDPKAAVQKLLSAGFINAPADLGPCRVRDVGDGGYGLGACGGGYCGADDP